MPAVYFSEFPKRSLHWHLRSKKLEFGSLPLLMGVLNVTPDSFSDGGNFLEPEAAVEQALRLEEEGADLIDIGGESTRPGSTGVSLEEERKRVLPVIKAVCEKVAVPVSVDTSKAELAREALYAGAELVNDITACLGDPGMIDVLLEQQPGICLMHMKGTPKTMQKQPEYENVFVEVFRFLTRRKEQLVQEGLFADRIGIDPGIGFGKRITHNQDLLQHASRFLSAGSPVVVGHSRKSFIETLAGPDATKERLGGTIGVGISLAMQGVQVLRVHEVAPMREALKLFEAAFPAIYKGNARL
jgi:dihydropteroate synthase